MAKEKKKWWWLLGLLAFIVYIFLAARPVSEEIVLKPRWISSPNRISLLVWGIPRPAAESPCPSVLETITVT